MRFRVTEFASDSITVNGVQLPVETDNNWDTTPSGNLRMFLKFSFNERPVTVILKTVEELSAKDLRKRAKDNDNVYSVEVKILARGEGLFVRAKTETPEAYIVPEYGDPISNRTVRRVIGETLSKINE